MRLCFATNNDHKLAEVRLLLPTTIELVSLREIGCLEELPETQPTLEGNARQKADYVWEHYGVPCFADDTGLEVAALNGEPGVYSARYAGPQRLAADNIAKLLAQLAGIDDRRACFKTVIALVLGEGQHHAFAGAVDGHITEAVTGTDGFGYDPVFRPAGHAETFAEMPLARKNTLSHRARAVEQLVHFLAQSQA